MADIPQELVDELAPAVAAVLPALAARVPAPPAARLGRLGAARGITALVAPRDHVFPMPGPFPPGATAADLGPGMWHGGPPVALELQRLPQLLTQRLLGALELNVPAIRVPAAGRLVTASITGNYGIMHTSGEAETASAVRLLDTLHPGTPEIVTALVARLAAHPEAAAALAVPPGVAGEDGIAAEHGARHLALAVAAAGAVLDAAEVLDPRTQRPVAVVGLGIGTAALLLREVPMPPGYLEAAFAAARTDYLMPRQTGGSVPVADHRFAVAEGDPEAFDAAPVRTAGFDRNGLVTEIEGGLVVRTGLAEGQVRVGVEVRDAAPRRVAAWAEEAVELTWRAGLGAGSVIGPDAPGDGHLLGVTPPWPGDFRVRVYAAGRDEAADDLAAGRPGESERYELVIWPAPAAPEVVHRRADRLGHRLRGEPEPERVRAPELAYRWVRYSELDMAATVTIATGLQAPDLLQAFGADPDRPESARGIDDDQMERGSHDPWLMVAPDGDAVIAVEPNGWHGTDAAVLAAASRAGRAAGVYWNVNGFRQLSFAERGRVVAAFEFPGDDVTDPAVRAALAGLDWDDSGDLTAKGLVAVERYTGHALTDALLSWMIEADVGYRVHP